MYVLVTLDILAVVSMLRAWILENVIAPIAVPAGPAPRQRSMNICVPAPPDTPEGVSIPHVKILTNVPLPIAVPEAPAIHLIRMVTTAPVLPAIRVVAQIRLE